MILEKTEDDTEAEVDSYLKEKQSDAKQAAKILDGNSSVVEIEQKKSRKVLER